MIATYFLSMAISFEMIYIFFYFSFLDYQMATPINLACHFTIAIFILSLTNKPKISKYWNQVLSQNVFLLLSKYSKKVIYEVKCISYSDLEK